MLGLLCKRVIENIYQTHYVTSPILSVHDLKFMELTGIVFCFAATNFAILV
jgi:hypothetical protein